MACYDNAREEYLRLGIDTDRAIDAALNIPVAMQCWQGDDVLGFENRGGLDGGIATTGDYPGRARNPRELMLDIEKAISLIPGKKRLNLHASYAITDEKPERDQLEPRHFTPWVDFALSHDLSLDFNPTYFSHPLAKGMTLASADGAVRDFWIRHTKRCLAIAQSFAQAQGSPALCNIWIPDGLKNEPADRYAPRERLVKALDEALKFPYDREQVLTSVEAKLFGIGLESYTVGSSEFYLCYALSRKLICLLDIGHFHPTEDVAEKLSALSPFFDKIALHVTRSIRWDSDHMPVFDDGLRELAGEIVRGDPKRFLIGMDYFDASLNRVFAWVCGMRAMRKALLWAYLTPSDFPAMQNDGRSWELIAARESLKTAPFGEIWSELLRRESMPGDSQLAAEIKAYEKTVLSGRKD